MDTINRLSATQGFQGFTRTSDVAPTEAVQAGAQNTTGENTATPGVVPTEGSKNISDFESHLRQFLPSGAAEINEEELYAGLLAERIAFLKSDEAASAYQEALGAAKSSHSRADGYVFVEDAANSAIDKLVADGTLSADEASQIKGQAFRAAQLDDNLSALYDGRGSSDDPTIAVESMETAILSAMAMLEQLNENPELAGDPVPTDSTPTDPALDSALPGAVTNSSISAGEVFEGNPHDGAEGFLFKPEAERDGKLVVLLPAEFTGSIASLLLKDENGNEIERGTHGGATNGNRDTYRFSKPGSEYSGPLTVELTLASGGKVTYAIPNPGERVD